MKKKTQYTVSILLLATAVVAVVSLAIIKIVDMQTVIDFTGQRTNVCEAHGIAMRVQLVGMTHGMPLFYPDGDPESDARRTSFPHADEPYCTGYCCLTVQTKARVYVCPKCTAAHKNWLVGNTGP
jgi:hypothetical protein